MLLGSNLWLGARRGLVLLMRVYDPNPKNKVVQKILREINILRHGYMRGKLSDKLVLDSLDKIEKMIKKLEKNE